MHLPMSCPTSRLGKHGVTMGELTTEFTPHVRAFDRFIYSLLMYKTVIVLTWVRVHVYHHEGYWG